MDIEHAHSLPAEMEKLAEGFESRDFPFASVCANKVLNLLAPDQPHHDEALNPGWVAEGHKAIKALESKDFGLASMCLRKAVKAYHGDPAIVGATAEDEKGVRHYLEEISIHVSAGDYSNVAMYVRKLAGKLQPTAVPPTPRLEQAVEESA
jgi:hypothetical protein